MSNVLFEIRYALRKFARSAGLTFALLLTIALGIGSNISIYGFILGLTNVSLPFVPADRVVSIFGQDAVPVTRGVYQLLRRCPNVFEWVGAARLTPGVLTIAHQSPIVTMASVTPNLASALRLSLGQGVAISHRIAGDEFAGEILINGTKAHVAGLAPASLEGLYRDRAVDVWMPMEEPAESTDGGRKDLWVLARLRPGVSTWQASEAIRAKSGGSSDAIRVVPYTGMMPEMQKDISRMQMLLGFAAGSVLWIACANVISLLLGRAFSRSPERSLRVALGATRAQLATELLWESVVISVAGGACGLLLAFWTSHVIPSLLFEEDAERLTFFLPVWNIVEICAACVGVMIACGLVPILVTSDDHPVNVLRRESSGPSKTMRRVRLGLVVGQMASCCVLVSSTAVLLAGFHAALQTGMGRRLGDPILITVQADPKSGIAYFREVERTVQAQPRAGVRPVAWVGRPPGTAATWQNFRIEPAHLPLRAMKADIGWLTKKSLTLLKMPPQGGRLFNFGDKGCRVAVVNTEAAGQLFGKRTVGRMMQESTGLAVQIIGVVAEKQARRATVFYNHMGEEGTVAQPITSAEFQAPVATDLNEAELDVNVISPSYFAATGETLTAGRVFTDQQAPDECRTAVVNQEAADLYFGGKAVGAAVIDYQGVRTEVIGVVNSRALGNFQRHAEPAIYLPMMQDYPLRMTLIAGAQNPSAAMLADLRQRIDSLPGRAGAPSVITTLSEHLSHTAMATLRIAVAIVGASASIALALSIVGLFSALGEAARQRRRDLAIRIALGAARWRVIGRVVGEGGRLALIAIILGMIGSVAVSRFLARVVSVDTRPEWWAWLAAPAALMLLAIVTSVIPARRALILNPARIMRDDNS